MLAVHQKMWCQITFHQVDWDHKSFWHSIAPTTPAPSYHHATQCAMPNDEGSIRVYTISYARGAPKSETWLWCFCSMRRLPSPIYPPRLTTHAAGCGEVTDCNNVTKGDRKLWEVATKKELYSPIHFNHCCACFAFENDRLESLRRQYYLVRVVLTVRTQSRLRIGTRKSPKKAENEKEHHQNLSEFF